MLNSEDKQDSYLKEINKYQFDDSLTMYDEKNVVRWVGIGHQAERLSIIGHRCLCLSIYFHGSKSGKNVYHDGDVMNTETNWMLTETFDGIMTEIPQSFYWEEDHRSILKKGHW